MVGFSNSNNDCGFDGCDLFINYLCLDPLNDVCNKGSCSLDEDSRDLDLERGLPKTTSLTSESQPWPVSESVNLYLCVIIIYHAYFLCRLTIGYMWILRMKIFLQMMILMKS